MIFLLSLEVALRFRNVFAEDDSKDYEQALIDDLDQRMIDGTVKPKDRQKNMKHIKESVEYYRQQNNKLGSTISQTVSGYANTMTEDGRKQFDSIADLAQMLMIQLNNSKNPKAMLSACQLYNAGVFDKAFEDVEKAKNKSGLSVDQAGLVDIHGNKL